MEQKPQANKQEKAGQGGAIFAKSDSAPAPVVNQAQPFFQNKPLIITIACLVLGAVVVFGVVKIIVPKAKSQKKEQAPVAKEEPQQKKKAEPVTPAPKAGSVKEKKTGASEEPTAVEFMQEAAVGGVSETVEPVAYKPPPKKTQPKKVKDTPGLTKMLDGALLTGNESIISNAVMGIEKNGDDVVDYLKEKIITNFDKPAVRVNAILALFYSSDKEAIAVIKTALMVDSDEGVRLTALSVLDSLCGQEELGFMQGIAKQDKSERVRKKALEYIELRSIGQ